MRHQPFTLLIHIALVIIMTGAIVTHFFGIQGELSLREGSASDCFRKESGPGDGHFPFSVRLIKAETDYYPGTTTPMDFRSRLDIGGKEVMVSMNKVAEIDGWRFYQSGISPDSTRLSVSHDPAGTGITYTGYALLLAGMIGYFFQKKTPWRALLAKSRSAAAVIMLLCAFGANAAETDHLPAMQRPLATNLGKAYVYWNDRVCPLQTMARDVALKLYGSETYQDLSSDQILSGWLFYFDTWERDYSAHVQKIPQDGKKRKELDEKLSLIHWLGTGEAFRIYPYRSASGKLEWLSLTGRRPSKMSLEQWKFMQTTMPAIKDLLLQGRNIAANEEIQHLIAGQEKYAGKGNLPSPSKIQAERIYNRFANLLPPGIGALALGIFYLFMAISGRDCKKWVSAAAIAVTILLLLYISCIIALIWYTGGHLPLSNGPEMMLFMSFVAMACALASRKEMLKGAFLTVSAMTLAVGAMGGHTPRIGMLMPVLASPLLSIHVMLIMTSYVFFLIMAILSAAALCSSDRQKKESLCVTNRIILLPAVFLLAAGIFVGAVWANQSWGRYWGWDPKETCALVMLIIYSVPLHWGSRQLRIFRQPKALHIYLLLAILSVLFTYFGANYFLSGLHSYA